MNIIENRFSIGAQKPFEIIHISDTHLTFADSRDDAKKNRLAEKRRKSFPNAWTNISEVTEYSNEKKIPVMCTGDLIDFVSVLNLEKARRITSSSDVFTSAGNHEFSLYVGEAFEDEAYKNQSLEKVQASFSNDIIFSSRIINGVNFVALDNSYYLVSAPLLQKLRNEVKKDYPVVLMLHVPLFTKELYDCQIYERGCGDAGLMCVPSELMKNYSAYRLKQQTPDDATKEAFDYIANEKNIRLILTGHLHYDFETVLPAGLKQIITGTDTMRKIVFE